MPSYQDKNGWIHLDRYINDKTGEMMWMCQICFEYKVKEELDIIDDKGTRTDVCKECAEQERHMV